MSVSELCLHCGLCCDGTLFRDVAISGDERERLVTLGIGVSTRRKHDVMLLPCGKLDGKRCTVYAQRPGGCQRFVCSLVRKLEAKDVTFDEAIVRVDEMHRSIDALRAVLPASNAPVLRAARELIDSPAPVSDVVLEAFKRVEAIRYSTFMPPPQPE